MLNVPSPNPERSAYARFIPREELGSVSNWRPGTLGGGLRPQPPAAEVVPPPPPPPQGPTHEEWLAQVDAARQAGYEQGYRDGMAALESFKKSHAEQMERQVGQVLQSLDAEFDGLHAQAADAVTEVALQLARQVLRSELEIAPAHVARVAAEAVEAVLLSARHITVQLHPQDLPLVAAGADEVLRARGARLVAHPGIERGGCRVESDAGAIDARIATRWAQAAGALGSEQPWAADADGDAGAAEAAA
ncbi:MAG: flagellar biosynthesis protein [Proteobacteria bacterium]|nr:flagellar biosynthesis protein [Pseudomonadota bacterium]